MTKNAKIITLVVVMLLALILSIVMVSVYATTHDDQVSSNGFTVRKTGSNCVITGYNGKDETVKIPHKVAGKKVVGIEPSVFKGKDIKNIEFDGTFEELELSEYAFSEMKKLEYVKLPEGLKKIPTGAFRNSTALSHVFLPSSLENIGEFAFQGCSNLVYTTHPDNDALEQKDRKFYFSNNLVRIEKAAFEGCRALHRVIINDKLEYVGVSAFQNAQNLKELTVSANSLISTIDDFAFNKTQIESSKAEDKKLIFPNLKVIGKGAFGNITSYFEYFELSKNIEEVRDQAFMGSSALQNVVYDKEFNPKTFGNGVFTNCVNMTGFTDKETFSKVGDNAMPEKMEKVPELTFSGCINLLNRSNFVIHANIKEIGDGAFAIYNYTGNPSRQMYTYNELKVAPENDYFMMAKLEGYNYGSNSHGKHSLLMSIDQSQLLAYIGGYTTYSESSGKYNDAYRETDMNGNKVDSVDKETYTAFTYLHQDTDIRNSLKTIKSYAFAGVRFDRIFIPNEVTKICDKAFFNSDINVVLFDKADCEFEADTFAGMPKDRASENGNCLMIGVTHGNEEGTIYKQYLDMTEKGLVADFAKMAMFK